jgi:hypothetical protein
MRHSGLRGNTGAYYEAIAEKNRERLHALTRLASKSPWAKYYLPIRPRRLTVTLMNGFRIAVNRGDVKDDEYRRLVASAVTIAIADPLAPATLYAVREAIGVARRTLGLLDPERRGTDPDPELSDDEHRQVEVLLREWLYVALAQFGSTEVA